MVKKLLLAAAILLGGLWSNAQSFEGKDFWIAYMPNSDNGGLTPTLHLISRIATNVNISVPGTGYSVNVALPAKTMVTRALPSSVIVTSSESVTKRGVHVTCPDDITVYTGSYKDYTSDAAIAIPTPNLGKNFDLVSYGFSEIGTSEFIIIGTEDNTNIKITYHGWTAGGKRTGNTANITLNTGETYLVQAYGPTPIPTPTDATYKDLSGTKIEVTNNKRIAVFTGNACVYAGGCPFCDHMYEQMRDPSTWGSTYYLVNTTKASTTADIMRVYALNNNTAYSINGVPQVPLNAGTWRDHDVAAGTVVTSPDKIHVSQILRGSSCSAPPLAIDPLLMDVLPAEQYGSDYLFGTSNYARYSAHYASVIMETAQTGTLQLDGVPVGGAWTAIVGTSYSTRYLNLASGRTYNLFSTNGSKFGLFVYGYGTEESYGYTAGGNLYKLDGCPIAKFTADSVCDGKPVVFNNSSFDPKFTITSQNWDFAGQGTSAALNPTFTFNGPGTYVVKLKVTNNNPTGACADSVTRSVVVLPNPTASAGPDVSVCFGDSAQLGGSPSASGTTAPYTYSWSPASGIGNPTAANPKAKPAATTTYELTVKDKFKCEKKDQVQVSLTTPDSLKLGTKATICKGNTHNLVFNVVSTNPGPFTVQLFDGINTATINNVQNGTVYPVSPILTTTYTITSFTAPSDPAACLYFDPTPVIVTVRELPDAAFSLNSLTLCQGGTGNYTVNLTGSGAKNFTITTGTAPINESNFSGNSKNYAISPSASQTLTLTKVEYSTAPLCTTFPNKTISVTVNPKRNPGAGITKDMCFTDPSATLFNMLTNNPELGGAWQDVNNAGINLAGDVTTSINPATIAPGSYQFNYKLSGTAPCPDSSATITINIKDAPVLSNIATNCSADNKTFTVSALVGKGTPSTYATEAGSTIVNQGNQYVFTSTSFPSKSNYSVKVWDASACDTARAAGYVNCGCLTDAGTMDQTPIDICKDALASATHNGDHNLLAGRNDILMFYLHEGNAKKIVNRIDSNLTPVFPFKPGMVYGKTYYISAVAGTAPNGYILFNDPDSCVSVAQGTPVRFFDYPTGAITGPTDICLNSPVNASTVFSGVAPFSAVVYYNGNTQNYTNQNVQNNYALNGVLNNDSIALVSISDKYCTNPNPSSFFKVNVHDTPSMLAASSSTLCAPDAETYVWTFTINNGDPGSYQVSAGSGTLSGAVFTSNPINSGSSLQVTITDQYNCGNDVQSISITCPCVSTAGAMPSTPVDVCTYNTAVVPVATSSVLDPNDIGVYVLSSSQSNPLGNAVWTGSNPIITFDSTAMSAETTYYLFHIVGNNNSGTINSSDRCLSISNGTPFTWRKAPNFLNYAANPALICEGGSATLSVTFSGNAPYQIFSSRNGVPQAPVNLGAGSANYPLSPIVNTQYSLDSVVDRFGCITRGPVLTQVNINPAPTFTMYGSTTICEGGSPTLSVKITRGIPPFNFTITDGQGYSAGYAQFGGDSVSEVVNLAPVGNNLYYITGFTDSLCAAVDYSSTVTITVNPNPTGYFLSAPTAICANNPLPITFNAPGSSVYDVDINANGSPFSFSGLSGGSVITTLPFAVGNNTYSITRISNQVTGCSSVLGTSVNTLVRALPIALACCSTNVCVGDSITVKVNNAGTGPFEITLGNGAGTFSNQPSGDVNLRLPGPGPAGTYYYQVEEIRDVYGCTQTYPFGNGVATAVVNPAPAPDFDIVNPKPDYCAPVSILLQDQTLSGLSYRSFWTIDNKPEIEAPGSLSILAEKPGVHTVVLRTANIFDCQASINKSFTVNPVPQAIFNFGNSSPTVLSPMVYAYNTSIAESNANYFWEIEPLGINLGTKDIQVSLPGDDEAKYLFKLKVTSPFGCVDSAKQYITVKGEWAVYLPNTFTPNGDGKNDVFSIKSFAADYKDHFFEFDIFNRWGERVFTGKNVDAVWDGRNKGTLVPSGIYTCRIRIKGKYTLEHKELMTTVQVLY